VAEKSMTLLSCTRLLNFPAVCRTVARNSSSPICNTKELDIAQTLIFTESKAILVVLLQYREFRGDG
jgi:recombinational DNA repair protein RecR